MSTIKTNLLILTLGLSLTAGNVKAGLFCGSEIDAIKNSCGSQIDAIKNSPEYKCGKYAVDAARFLASLPKNISRSAHQAIVNGFIQYKADWVAMAKNPRTAIYCKALAASYACGGLLAVTGLALNKIAKKTAEKIKEAMYLRKLKKIGEQRQWLAQEQEGDSICRGSVCIYPYII